MTPDERKAHLRTILDQHNEAVRTFRASSDAFDHKVEGMRHTMTAIQEANQAQREAIDAIIAANNAALALFHDEA